MAARATTSSSAGPAPTSCSATSGADTFQYFATSDSPVGGSDLIADFTSGVDKIELRPIHTGGAADVFSLTQINGVTYLNVDLGNDGSIEMQIVITGTVVASDVLWT